MLVRTLMVGAHAMASTELISLKTAIIVELITVAIITNSLQRIVCRTEKARASWSRLLQGWVIVNTSMITVATLLAGATQK